MAYSNRPSKRAVPDVAPVMREPDGTLVHRPPFKPSVYQETKNAVSAWNRRATREGMR